MLPTASLGKRQSQKRLNLLGVTLDCGPRNLVWQLANRSKPPEGSLESIFARVSIWNYSWRIRYHQTYELIICADTAGSLIETNVFEIHVCASFCFILLFVGSRYKNN